jgi:Cof subfamily protein (haloacid dehalogenase superfamily)
MNIKALFFDIDGTLVSFNTHTIPQSTIDSLRLAKQQGIKLFIATGRPLPIIVNIGQITELIDGYITTNGAICFVGDEVVSSHSMQPQDVQKILEACDRWHAPCIVVGEKNLAVFNDQPIVDSSFREGLGLETFQFADLHEVLQGPILQLTPFITTAQEQELLPQLNACTSGRWTTAFTDITHKAADKGQALVAMAAHSQFEVAQTMAFGDGGNDITMLRQAGIGVAMGNAGDDVKANADFITTSVDEDGIRNALAYFNVGLSPLAPSPADEGE